MRAGITIIYNGLHHLKHGGFTQFMLDNFDYWIVVEGLSRNGGSTSWMRTVRDNPRSTDGTIQFMQELAKENKKVLFYSHHKHYSSKDEQFNKAIALLQTKTQRCYLWQVDADEHWNAGEMAVSERKLWRSPYNVASFQFNHFVKTLDNDLVVAVGEWGSTFVNRLWKWRGQFFVKHEPAIMERQTLPLQLPYKFDHYSMTFEQDVRFKARAYPGNELVYRNWIGMEAWEYPCHISQLFGKNNKVGRSDSTLYKYSQLCANVPNLKVEKEAGNLC